MSCGVVHSEKINVRFELAIKTTAARFTITDRTSRELVMKKLHQGSRTASPWTGRHAPPVGPRQRGGAPPLLLRACC